MANTDKVLEAEKRIQEIASELKRMRDAASLLESSQKQVDTVLRSAQSVITATEKFTNDTSTIIGKLSSMDLNKKIDDLQTIHDEIESVKMDLLKTLEISTKETNVNIGNKIESTYSKIEELLNSAIGTMQELSKQNKEHIEGGNKFLNDKLSSINKDLKQLITSNNKSFKKITLHQYILFASILIVLIISIIK